MRHARIIVPGANYHVTHRGNRKHLVFFDDADREHYCHWLDFHAAMNDLAILAFALMPNHVHLVVRPEASGSLARTIREAHSRHAVWINRRHGWSGHLWANRFYSTVLDEDHLRNAIRYVEMNPVRAGIVARAENYAWSSAAQHCGLPSAAEIQVSPSPLPEVQDWSDWLRLGALSDDEVALRRNTYAGKPTGSREFISCLESMLARRIQPRQRGRPRKSSK